MLISNPSIWRWCSGWPKPAYPASSAKPAYSGDLVEHPPVEPRVLPAMPDSSSARRPTGAIHEEVELHGRALAGRGERPPDPSTHSNERSLENGSMTAGDGARRSAAPGKRTCSRPDWSSRSSCKDSGPPGSAERHRQEIRRPWRSSTRLAPTTSKPRSCENAGRRRGVQVGTIDAPARLAVHRPRPHHALDGPGTSPPSRNGRRSSDGRVTRGPAPDRRPGPKSRPPSRGSLCPASQ